MTKLRILIAEDHETIREGIKLLINAQPDMDVIGEAGDGLLAVQRTQTLLPDLVLMDVSMPGATGFQATEQLNRTCPEVKVLALTRHRDKAYLQQLVRAGYDGEHPLRDDRQPWISRREEEVLKLIAWGHSNKEIGAKLDISVKTVEAHRANAMRKLDLHSRIDIVRFALTQGWLNEG